MSIKVTAKPRCEWGSTTGGDSWAPATTTNRDLLFKTQGGTHIMHVQRSTLEMNGFYLHAVNRVRFTSFQWRHNDSNKGTVRGGYVKVTNIVRAHYSCLAHFRRAVFPVGLADASGAVWESGSRPCRLKGFPRDRPQWSLSVRGAHACRLKDPRQLSRCSSCQATTVRCFE